MKPNNILVRVIATIALALLILAASFQASIHIAKEKMEESADKAAEQKYVYLNMLTNLFFQSQEWLINTFLAGVIDIQSYEDSVTHTKYYKAVIDDRTRQTLTGDDIYESIENYCDYNDEANSVVLIFKPGVLRRFPRGIAAKVSPNSAERHNLIKEGYNIFGSELYKNVEASDKPMFRYDRISEDSVLVFSTGVGIRDEQGNVVGEFWVDVDASKYSRILVEYSTEKNLIQSFINKDCQVAASSNRKNNGKYIKDIALELDFGKGFEFDEWYSKVQSAVHRDSLSIFRNQVEDQMYVTYIMPIKGSPYSLLLVKSEQALYEGVSRFVWKDIILMIISLLLVTLCLVYIFKLFKNKYDETNRMAGELNVAADIQRAILPANPVNQGTGTWFTSQHSSSGEPRTCPLVHDIYGFQRSAKSVGGDLYDFVQKGDLLHFCIGDVSGKGMPAALVMTEICSLYRYITNYQSDPKEIVTRMNKAVMERSDDSMFCTLFVGVLDLKSGLLQFCNAGHNPPIFLSGEKAEYMKIKPNMPIYAFADYAYQSESLQLNAGDRLFLYTDGVTEAKDKNDNFYGEKATLASIERCKGLPFNQLVNGVLDDINAFVKRAEQNDDITMLCLEYRGSQPTVETRPATSPHNIHYNNVKGRVSEIVDEILNTCQKPDDMKLRLAIEEPVQNIADYAYSDDGPLDVEIFQEDGARSVSTGGERETISITLKDSGKPFNPLESETPDLSVGIEEREVGGLGIFLTRQIMSDVSYRYENNQNILILKYTR